MRTHLLVDGSNFFIRAFCSCPHLDVNGEHVGGLIGTIRGVKVLARELKPTDITVVWDGAGGAVKRRAIYAEYKAGRKPKMNRAQDFDTPDQAADNMVRQHRLAHKYLELLGVRQVRVDGIEADDAIAYAARHVLDELRVIVSTDRDFLQLVSTQVSVYNPVKRSTTVTDGFVGEHGVLPENFVITKALMGDKSDNIPGVRGIGEKTVAKLFPDLATRECTLGDVFRHAEVHVGKSPKYGAVLAARELVIRNLELMQLSLPQIDPSAARAIREGLSAEPSLNLFDVKIEMERDGLQIKDVDFDTCFRAYWNRHLYPPKGQG